MLITLNRAVVPTIQSYEDAGDFTVTERLKTSIRANLVFYVCVGSIGLIGLILLILMRGKWFVSYLFMKAFLMFFFVTLVCVDMLY